MSTMHNEKLRRIMREPRRPLMQRINPRMVVGACIAFAAIWLTVSTVVAAANVARDCRPASVRGVSA